MNVTFRDFQNFILAICIRAPNWNEILQKDESICHLWIKIHFLMVYLDLKI